MKNHNTIHSKLIAKIHIAKQQLGMDDDTYRCILERVTKQTSCQNLNQLELKTVINEMQRLGFNNAIGRMPLHRTDAAPMMRKIAVLLKKNNKTWKYANAISQKMFKKEKISYLNNDELHSLIAALQYYTSRQVIHYE